MKAVALEMGVNPSLVQDTIRGVKNNRRVLVHLFDMGCPEDYLSLPSNVKAEISQRSMEVR
jgi:NDP-sugar pyrophosphorylase family protein